MLNIILMYGIPVAFVIGILFFIYSSWGTQLCIEILRALIGGIFAAALVFMISILSPIKKIENKTEVYLLALKNIDPNPNIYSNHLIPLEFLTIRKFGFTSNPLEAGYVHVSTENEQFIRRNRELNIQIGNVKDLEYFLELMEWSTLTWIRNVYGEHWQTKVFWFNGISGGGGKSYVPADSDKAEKLEINAFLKDNRFSNGEKKYIYLPPRTKARYIKLSDGLHIIEFKNRNTTFRIKFELGVSESINATDLAEKIIQRFGRGLGQQIEVTFEMEPNLFFRWTTNTDNQIQWFNGLMNSYNESFSWYILKDKLNQSLEVDSFLSEKK